MKLWVLSRPAGLPATLPLVRVQPHPQPPPSPPPPPPLTHIIPNTTAASIDHHRAPPPGRHAQSRCPGCPAQHQKLPGRSSDLSEPVAVGSPDSAAAGPGRQGAGSCTVRCPAQSAERWWAGCRPEPRTTARSQGKTCLAGTASKGFKTSSAAAEQWYERQIPQPQLPSTHPPHPTHPYTYTHSLSQPHPHPHLPPHHPPVPLS